MDVRELRRPSVSGRPRSPVKRPVRRETRYDGFISYSHALDGKLAPAVQRGLGRFARPTLDPAEAPRRLNLPSEVRTADPPRSTRFEPASHVRGFHDWFLHSCACPSRLPGPRRLAVPTCPVVVGAALAALGTSRDRLPQLHQAGLPLGTARSRRRGIRPRGDTLILLDAAHPRTAAGRPQGLGTANGAGTYASSFCSDMR